MRPGGSGCGALDDSLSFAVESLCFGGGPGGRAVLREDSLTGTVIGLALRVHRQLGPGLLESVYEEALCFELQQAGIAHERQAAVPVVYGNVELPAGFRADVLVEDDLLLEIKSVESLSRLHEAQVLTYLRMTGRRTGLLLNFNTLVLKDGLRRFVRG